MHRYLKASLLASALAATAIPTLVLPSPSNAAVSVSINFNYFHDNLSNYGDWAYSSRWGRVWRPDVDADFRPYTRGHWAYTDDYGWLWVSDEPFGDITYHYGRWVNDPYDGWLWIPGYVWSPGWVVWRSGGDYTGWMPMPPTEAFLEGDETSYDISDDYDYGYRRWYPDYSDTAYASLWIFVGNRYIGDRNYRRYAVDRPRVTNIIHRTRNVTNYTIVNNYVVNRSVNVDAVRRAGGKVQRVRAASVVKRPALITRADQGRQIQARMRKEAPHGTGRPDSAPKPTAEQIQTLSPTIRARGKKPVNLMTRAKAQELRTRNAPGANAAQTPERKPQEAKPESGTAAPQTQPERMREGQTRGRDRNEPASAAKPAETTPDRGKPNDNRDNEQRNNMLRRTDKLPAETKTPEKPVVEAPAKPTVQAPEKPAVQTPETPKPERVRRPMREERVQPKENAVAPGPARPEAKPAPAEPDRSRMRDEMRQRMQERTNERAREPAATPAAPPDRGAVRQQAAPPERQQMREQTREPMRERAQPPAVEQKREKPADNEKRGNRGEKEDKDKKPGQPNE
jgi:hypothetical protein